MYYKLTYLCSSNLSQINLIRQMSIAHTIFVSRTTSWCPGPSPNQRARLIRQTEFANITFVVHFEIDTYSPIKTGSRTVNIEIRNATFDDPSKNCACSLVCCDTDLGLMAGVKMVLDYRWECGGGYLVERVSFLFVGIGQWDAGARLRY